MRLIQNHVCGENRVVLLDNDDRLKALYIQREERLNLNEVVSGVIAQKMPNINGYFADTSKNESVFIPSMDKYEEGQRVNILITKEERMGKVANGKVVSLSPTPAPDIADVLSRTYNLPIEECWDDLDLDSRVLGLLTPSIPLEGGGTLHIERTNAVWAVDVDTGASDLEAPIINQRAVKEIARQIKLRGLSGIIVIDFAGAKHRGEQEVLHAQLAALLKNDERCKVLNFTASRLMEIKRRRTYSSIADILLDDNNRLSAASIGYMICRAVIKSKRIMPTVVARPEVIRMIREKLKYKAKFQPSLNIEPDFFEIKE